MLSDKFVSQRNQLKLLHKYVIPSRGVRQVWILKYNVLILYTPM